MSDIQLRRFRPPTDTWTPGEIAEARNAPRPPSTSGIAALLAAVGRGPDRGWVEHAACRGMGHDVFFPEAGQAVGPALKVCSGCPVVAECNRYADSFEGRREGIWGAQTAVFARGGRTAQILAANGKPTTCSADGCSRDIQYVALSLCRRCYERRRHGRPELPVTHECGACGEGFGSLQAISYHIYRTHLVEGRAERQALIIAKETT